MKPAIQYTETFKTAVEAIQVSAFLRGQDGFIGQRILAPGKDAGFTVQVFFDDPAPMKNGATNFYGEWLPTGCRRVLMPESIYRHIG
jgi:hypothetical protein